MPLGFARNAGLITSGGGAFDYSASGSYATTTYGIYTSIFFYSTGNFNILSNGPPSTGLTCDILVVAGGGGGGASNPGAGGGGGGGFREFTNIYMPPETWYVSIGAGGATGNPGASGTQSYISGPVVTNMHSSGGGGGGYYTQHGVPGGSGGGGGGQNGYVGGTGNSGGYSPVEGYAGGAAATSSYYKGGGGGGAGGTGYQAYYSYMTPTPYQDGGAGRTNYYRDGSNPSYAYGSFAGGGEGYASAGWRGRAGGGNSNFTGYYQSATAPANGGGGGAGLPYAGGSGCVVIRWVTP